MHNGPDSPFVLMQEKRIMDTPGTAERAPRHDGWTPERKTRFLDHLAARGNVRLACARVGLSPEAAYCLRRRDARFARGWAAALVLAREGSVQVLADRAIDGVEEPIYYRGELVGSRRKYDSRLLLAHIARLDRLVDEKAAAADARRFDELLAWIAEEPVPPQLAGEPGAFPLDRERAAQQAAIRAEEAVRFAEPEDEEGPDEDDGDGTDVWELDCDAGDASVAAHEDECIAAYRRGRTEGEKGWDLWFAEVCHYVDRTAGRLDPPVAAGLPGSLLPLPGLAPAAGAQPDGRAFSPPCTPSGVSRSSLARALAGPVKGFVVTPRSPLQAPRELAMA
jgi:hypothetical protein